MVDIFDSADFVRVEVKYIELCQSLEVLNLLDVVFAEHEDS